MIYLLHIGNHTKHEYVYWTTRFSRSLDVRGGVGWSSVSGDWKSNLTSIWMRISYEYILETENDLNYRDRVCLAIQAQPNNLNKVT